MVSAALAEDVEPVGTEKSEESRGTSMKMLAGEAQTKAVAAGAEGGARSGMTHGAAGAEGAAAATGSMMSGKRLSRMSVDTEQVAVDSVMRVKKRAMVVT